MRLLGWFFVGSIIVAASACGGGGLPPGSVASLTSAQAAVRAAEETGANDVPRAALHLKFAKEQITSAQELLEDGQEEGAGRMLSRAEADAEVALAIARRSQAEEEEEAAQARLNA